MHYITVKFGKDWRDVYQEVVRPGDTSDTIARRLIDHYKVSHGHKPQRVHMIRDSRRLDVIIYNRRKWP